VSSQPEVPERPDEFWAATPTIAQLDAAAQALQSTDIATALHLKLLPNVTLVIEGSDDIGRETLSAILPALESLKAALTKNGGIARPTTEDGETKPQQSINDAEREQQ